MPILDIAARVKRQLRIEAEPATVPFPPKDGIADSLQRRRDGLSQSPSPVIGHGSGCSPQNPAIGLDEHRDDRTGRLDTQVPHEPLAVEIDRDRHIPDFRIRNAGPHTAVDESGNRTVPLRDHRQLIDPEPWILVCQCSRRRHPGINIALLPLPERNEEEVRDTAQGRGKVVVHKRKACAFGVRESICHDRSVSCRPLLPPTCNDSAPEGVLRPMASSPQTRSVLSTSEGVNRDAFSAMDWTLFVSISLIWGSSFLLMAIGLEAFEPGLITLLRVGLGAAVPLARPRSAGHPCRASRLAAVGRVVGGVGGDPVHALPDCPAVHQLGDRRHAQRCHADLRGGHRGDDAAASPAGRDRDRPHDRIHGRRRHQRPIGRRGWHRGARSGAGGSGHRLLRIGGEHRRPHPAGVRIDPVDGTDAWPCGVLDRSIRTLRRGGQHVRVGSVSRRCGRRRARHGYRVRDHGESRRSCRVRPGPQ